MNPFPSIIATALALLAQPLLASSTPDVIKLKNGNIISGIIGNSEIKGIVTLTHSGAKTALKIKESSIQEIDFGTNRPQLLQHDENILLTNGDYFPCQILSIDDNQVTFNSTYMGRHSIPRNKVGAIKFNNSAKNILYSGPDKNLNGWKSLNSRNKDAWSIKNKILSCSKYAKISRSIKGLPESHVLEMDLQWTSKSPQLKIYFCNESDDLRKKPDGYYLSINAQGFGITRYLKGRSFNLGHTFPNPQIFKDKEIHIALYIDRQNQTITLYINGKEIKQFKDHSRAPKGSLVILAPSPMKNTKIMFKGLKVSTWNGGQIVTSSKTAASLKNNDVLTDTNGNSMTGKLKNINKTNGELHAAFNIAFAKKPIDILAAKILQINFKLTNDSKEANKLRFSAQLSMGGSLSFDQSQWHNNQLGLTHPILGEIQLSQDVIIRIAAKKTLPKTN